MNKNPDFIIIGAMKCATSTLHEQLALQPGIFMTEPKEPNFFSNDEEYEKGLEWYLSLFETAQITDFCGESSTHYTKLPTYPHTIERLQQHFPNVKLIYIMRHPIDRLVSQYIHEWTQQVISYDINQAIIKHPELIEYSLYTKQLKPYFEAFGQDKILPIFFERFIKFPQEELERVCQFIGYSGQPTWKMDLEIQNASAERLRKSAWRDFLVEAPVLKEIRKTLIPKSFRNWVKGFWTMKKRPQLTEENLKYLQGIFDQDLEILGNWLGIPNFSCSSFKTEIQHQAKNWRS